MTRTTLIEPGTDILKINTKRARPKIPWLWLSVIFFAALAVFMFLRSNETAKAVATQPAVFIEQTVTPSTTPGGPTLTATPRPTATGLFDGASLPQIAGSTQQATAAGCQAQIKEVQVTRIVSVPQTCNSTSVQVEVTRVVEKQVKVEVTRLATQLVTVVVTATMTATPTPTATATMTPTFEQPTSTITPWIIVVTATPEATATPTATLTASQTPTPTITPPISMEQLTPTATNTPSLTPTALP